MEQFRQCASASIPNYQTQLTPCSGSQVLVPTPVGWISAGSPGQFLPLGIASHCPRPPGAGEEAGGRAGWGQRGGTYEFRPVRGGGRPPLRSPPGRFPPRSTVWARRGAVRHRHPGFVRSGFQAIDWDSAKVETLRYHHECNAPMVTLAQMGSHPLS